MTPSLSRRHGPDAGKRGGHARLGSMDSVKPSGGRSAAASSNGVGAISLRLAPGEWLTIAIAVVLVAGLVIGVGLASGGDRAQWVTLAAALGAGAIVLAVLVYACASRNALRRQVRLLEHFGDTMNWSRLVVDRGGAPVWSNQKLAEVFPGVKSLADLERRVCGDGEARERFRRAWESALSGTGVTIELAVQGRRGTEVYGVGVHPVAGMPDVVSWRVEDVTNQRQMEQVIREEQAKIVDFLENAPVGF